MRGGRERRGGEEDEDMRGKDRRQGERGQGEDKEDVGISVAECNKSRKSAVCSVLCSDFVVGRKLYNLADFTFNSLLP